MPQYLDTKILPEMENVIFKDVIRCQRGRVDPLRNGSVSILKIVLLVVYKGSLPSTADEVLVELNGNQETMTQCFYKRDLTARMD